ncbi:MAG: prepilin peptidase [Gemmatimonadetes bacterium]|nr:prepilin peptidase [Gemmatimonadota bacterium]
MTFLGTFAFLVGASVGSFLNVCISRWPAELSVVRPRSRCPRCERAIAWYDNIPLLSWVILRAKCRGCGLPISAQYPFVELLVALLWLAAMLAFGPTLTMLRVAVGTTILLGIAATDLQHYVIPDGFTVTGFLFAMAMPIVAIFVGEQGPFAGPWDALIGACVGAGIIAIVGWLGEVALGKEAMGQGDVTLMAFVGAMVGPGRALLTVFVAALIGTGVFLALVLPVGMLRARAKGVPFEAPLVPFGVFLAPAGALTLLWGDPLIDWYLATLTS